METDCVSSRDRRFVSHSPVATYPPKLKSLGANQPSNCEKQAWVMQYDFQLLSLDEI